MNIYPNPSTYVRSIASQAALYLDEQQIIVNVAKGIEPDSCRTMSEVIESEIRQCLVAVLSGPTHAEKVAMDLPTTIVSAKYNLLIAEKIQRIFSNSVMRVYTNADVKGVELCGALKNYCISSRHIR